ncbi:MAG: hypothetical protein D6761_07550 [Candidatus Dadabacteria bacterium]|nr:MAG: hypothetical protein D6761_07550 [Candidatus Dadabacteria bacterium]
MSDMIQTFLQFFWFPALVSTILLAGMAAMGVFYAYRGMAFVNLTVAQGGTLAVVATFALGLEQLVHPQFAAIVAGAVLGYVFGRRRADAASDAWLTALLYAGMTGLTVIGIQQLPHEAHDINSALMGSAVLVSTAEGVVGILLGAIGLCGFTFWSRGLAAVYFFPEAARVRGLPVRMLRVAGDVLGGALIALSASTVGLLPTFAAAVVASGAAAQLVRRFAVLPAVTVVVAVTGAAGGFFLAYVLDWPVGPTQTVLWATLWAVGSIIRLLIHPAAAGGAA